MITLFQILFVAAVYINTNAISRACESAVSQLAIGRRHSARLRRIVPCDLRLRVQEPVSR